MATQQRNFRVPNDIESDIHALRFKNESVTQCYLRVIRAGIAVIKGQEHAETAEEGNPQLVEALQSTIDTLREQLAHEREQIAAYRAQLDNALDLVSQGQTLRLVDARRAVIGNGDGLEDTPTGERVEISGDEPTTTVEDGAEAHVIESDTSAEPLTFGEALRFWFNRTPIAKPKDN